MNVCSFKDYIKAELILTFRGIRRVAEPHLSMMMFIAMASVCKVVANQGLEPWTQGL